jgi:hypothetical protein
MPRNAFKFLRENLHFADNDDKKPKGDPGFDPLFKVRLTENKELSLYFWL